MVNKKVYIGRSIRLRERYTHHLLHLRSGKHGNPYLQASFDKHGESCFLYGIIEFAPQEELHERELYWINQFKSDDDKHGYNMVMAGNNIGSLSVAHRKKISEALMGRKGKTPSAEVRAKISAALKKQSDILRARATGVPCRDETRKKIAATLSGRRLSDEHKLHIALGGTGRTTTLETKAKISAFHKGNKWNLGHKRSPETRALLSEKAKLREARKKLQCLTNNNAWRSQGRRVQLELF